LTGASYFRLKRFREAADQFKNFWRRYPKHPLEESSHYALAWSLVSLGQYSEGRKTFEDILLTHPGTRLSDPIFWGIVKTYLGADEVERAILLYQRFLSQFLSSPWAEQCLFDIGQYYFGKKEYSNTISIFRQFLRTYPESELHEWVHFMLGEPVQSKIIWCDRCLSTGLEQKEASLEAQVFKIGLRSFLLKGL
jgi:outer membrane protein assembly factor BamD (BamD/ComL family)